MAKTVFDVLAERIEEQKTSALQFLADGGAKDYAEYRNVCGLLRGLQISLSNIEDLSRNFLEDDDG
tara:strand:+ start:5791 stop:5988 length:198 start_codon:yes stop_codon:yes gene_type:complete